MREFEQVEVRSRSALRSWLAANHARKDPVWLISHKKNSPHYLAYDDIVEEALCFGWIDSTARSLDEMRSMLLLSPRRKASPWSKVNKARVASLARAGLIETPGWAKIEAAKKDGTWSILDDVEALVVPDDLARALKKNAAARKHFEAYPPSVKKGFLWKIKSAKKPETREKWIAKTVELAAQNRRPT
jgi:uncharacterized protein YdeI (YjbR/CyaY-like superfamily)